MQTPLLPPPQPGGPVGNAPFASPPDTASPVGAAAEPLAPLADSLRPVVLKLGRRLRQEGLKVGLSPLDAQLLAVIKVKPGLGVCDLADLEQMSRPAMSVHLKRLEGAGWLERRGGEGGDRRRRSLYLTPKGAAALSAIRRSRTDWLAARLERLSDADREALRACLGPLVRLAEMKS